MTARRRFIASSALALSSALAPLLARAQAPARNVTIGILNFGDAPKTGAPPEPITVALRGLGYVEGRNVRYIRRYAGGKRDAYAMLAAAILREPVDVVYTPGSDIAQAFKAAGPRVPIVFTASDDPVASGLVQTLARPGGMFTGVTLMSPELAGKRLELLKIALPALRRVAILYDPQHNASYMADMQAAAQRMDVAFLPVRVDEPTGFPAAFDTATKYRADAMFVEPNRFTLICARPADLPVEQPTRFVLVVNQRTAKALGLALPESLLLRADEVIE
jgi:putative ABC transport system substrate-binding protein